MPILLSLVLVAFLITSSAGHPLLYKRQVAGTYPSPSTIGPEPLPAWVARYESAKAAGLLVDAAPSPYAAGVDVGSQGLCSWTISQCLAEADLVTGPEGRWGVSFDDGPSPNSPTLYNFLESMNQSATHFMIGGNILSNPGVFQQALSSGGQIAIHTWSHPQMTTLTDMQILGELGWTSQIIFDLSGLIPRYWRPSYGDVDNRVRAIAREVFGLKTVIWSSDSSDWCLTEGGGSSCGGNGPTSDEELDASLLGFATGPKSPGLTVLQHELTTRSISSFVRTYAEIIAQGWEMMTIADFVNESWYRNSPSNAGPIDSSIGIVGGVDQPIPLPQEVAPPVFPSPTEPTTRSASRTTTVIVTVTLPRPTPST